MNFDDQTRKEAEAKIWWLIEAGYMAEPLRSEDMEKAITKYINSNAEAVRARDERIEKRKDSVFKA